LAVAGGGWLLAAAVAVTVPEKVAEKVAPG